MQIDKEALTLLRKLQTLGESYIIGGYLRDTLCGLQPKDVDFATCASVEVIKDTFPQFYATERGLAFGVAKIKYKGTEYELSFYSSRNDFLRSLSVRDLIVNSIYHDGEKLVDLFGGMEDIHNKILRAHPDSFAYYTERPQQFLRVIRLQSQLGFSLCPKLHAFLQKHTALLDELSETRIQEEGYKILSSPYPLLSIQTLMSYELMPEHSILKAKKKILPTTNNLTITIGVLIAEMGLQPTLAFLNLFKLAHKYTEKAERIANVLDTNAVPHNPSLLNQLIQIKKIQFQTQPEKFQQFLTSIRKKKP